MKRTLTPTTKLVKQTYETVICMYGFQVAEIVFSSFSTEYEASCNFDMVSLMDDVHYNRYCGNNKPPDFKSARETAYVYFSSNANSVTRPGFMATITFTKGKNSVD